MVDIQVPGPGATVTASLSDRVVVRLPENGGTGYQWSVTEIGDVLEVESSTVVLPGELAPGAAGERVVVVRPRAVGRARVSLVHKRQWEDDALDHFTFDVDVRPT